MLSELNVNLTDDNTSKGDHWPTGGRRQVESGGGASLIEISAINKESSW